MIEKLQFENITINLLSPKTSYARKTGLLNHVKLNQDEGIIYKDKRIFHTFGMNFPILTLCLDKKKNLISNSKVIEQDSVFIAPRKSYYVLEIHPVHQNQFFLDRAIEQDIKVFSHKKAKFIYGFFRNITLIVLALSLFIMTYSFAFAEEKMNLNLGKSRVLDLGKPPQSIQISDPEILDVQRIGISNSVRIVPKRNGDSSIAVLYSGGEEIIWNIHVGKSLSNHSDEEIGNQESNFGEESVPAFDVVSRPLKSIQGIQISKKSGKLVVLGKVTKIEDFRKIAKIVSAHPTIFFPAFEFVDGIEKAVLNSVNTDLSTLGERNLIVTIRNGLFTVTGVASSPAGKVRAWNFLNGLVPNIVDATSYSSGESSVIQVNLDFLEVGKSNGMRFGFNIPGMSDASAALNFPVGQISRAVAEPALQIAPMNVFFKALEEKNFAREIARPVVITRSGEKASFLAGGEVPVVSSIGNNISSSSSVAFKPFGILFNVTPQAQLDGSIWLKLDLEVSQVSEALSYQNIPGFTTRKVSTNIILKEGNTAVLSGLVHNKDLKQVEKFPLLGSLPILGELFKSRRFQNQNTELWVAVTALRWNPEDQDINAYQNKILEKKFSSAKKFTQPSLID